MFLMNSTDFTGGNGRAPQGAQITDAAVHGEMPGVTILGGGPCGLYAAFFAGLRGMRTAIIDSQPVLGGQLATIYPEKFVYDVPGFPKVLARDLAKGLVDQAMAFEPTVHLGEKIVSLKRVSGGELPADANISDESGANGQASESSGGYIVLESASGKTFKTKTVILAMGAGAFLPKKLKAANAAEFENHGLHYFVNGTAKFKGKRLLIVGAGDTAFDYAHQFKNDAAGVLMIHRHDRLRAHESTVASVLGSGVEFRTFWEVLEIYGEEHVTGAKIFNNQTGEEEQIEVDEIIACLGFLADLKFLKDWGLTLSKNACLTGSAMQTNVPGVYACGDIATHEGKIKLISTGQGEAAIAVNFICNTLNPELEIFPGHSTNMDLPEFAKHKSQTC